jgi:hypothetical protein
LGVVALIGAIAHPGWSQPRSYRLDAVLDAEAHVARGSGEIILDNQTERDLQQLWVHLYLNAFKNTESLFLRSPFERARGGRIPSQWGQIELTRLATTQGVDLLDGSDFEGSKDETLLRVPLPQALHRGQSLVLHIEWRSKLPSVVDRTGYADDYYFVAQWFPKLAKLEPDGHWDAKPFHPFAEFYSDFCDYEVTLDVPAPFVVGATGDLVESSIVGERRRLVYRAHRVHDFAWTAWTHFAEHTETLSGTSVRFLYPPGHEHNLDVTIKAIRHGLEFFGEHFGRYPYPTLTVVHPPRKGRASGGMEYPQLITTDGSWYSNFLTRQVEQVALHELAHQWFYGVLGSNERDAPFLDEGFTSFADGLAAQDLYGDASGVSLLGLNVSALAYYRWLGLARGHDVAIATAAANFPSFRHLGAVVYGRTATLLHTMSRVYGDRFDSAFEEYARRNRFSHPSPQDFYDSIQTQLNAREMDDLVTAIEQRGWVDYAVTRVESVERPTPEGIFDKPTPTLPENPPKYVGRVIVVRRGTLHFPVEIVLTDVDGGQQRSTWSGEDDWTALDWVGDVELESAVVDPERRVLLDEDLSNNARTTQAGTESTTYAFLAYFWQILSHLLGP